MNDRTRIIDEARAARDQARQLLHALLESEQAAREGGHEGDLFRRVTGASSLENAIAATRRTIDAYDRLLQELEGGEPRSRDASDPAPRSSLPGDIEHAPRIMIGPMTLAALSAARTA